MTTKKHQKSAIKTPITIDLKGIEKAIRKLPLKPKFARMSRPRVNEIIEEMAIEVASSGYPLGPSILECGSDQTLKELSVFRDKTRDLLQHVKSMHKTSHIVFTEASVWSPIMPEAEPEPAIPLIMLEIELEKLLPVTESAIRRIKLIPNVRKNKASIKDSERVTTYLCELYTRLTGRKPTRVTKEGKTGGPAHEFLGSIFKAFGIKLSAENQLRVYGV